MSFFANLELKRKKFADLGKKFVDLIFDCPRGG